MDTDQCRGDMVALWPVSLSSFLSKQSKQARNEAHLTKPFGHFLTTVCPGNTGPRLLRLSLNKQGRSTVRNTLTPVS